MESALADILSLRLYAGIHPRHEGYHRMLRKRFPFAAYYEIVEQIARVIAVLDMCPNPKSYSFASFAGSLNLSSGLILGKET